MGKQRNGRIDPNNKYVMALGAHEPPAPPEKELAEARGMKHALWVVAIVLFLVIDVVPALWRAHTEATSSTAGSMGIETIVSDPVETELEETTAPTEEQKEIGFLAFLKKSNGRLADQMIDGETYRISPGDTIEVWGYSDYAEIKRIVYGIDQLQELNTTVPSIQMEDGIGWIPLPDYPAGKYFRLRVSVEDIKGNWCEYEYYRLVYESEE